MNPLEYEISQSKLDILRQSWTKVGHVQHEFLTVAEAAKTLEVSTKTISRWCESGKLQAVPHEFGRKKTYLIRSFSVLSILLHKQMKTEHVQSAPSPTVNEKSHQSFVLKWEKAMANGLMTGKPFSDHTLVQYKSHIEKFLLRHEVLSLESLKAEMLDMPVDQFGRKDKFFKAVICFAKFLIEEKALDEAFLEKAKKLKPKRHKPPKQLTVNEEQLQKLMAVCETKLEKALLLLLSSTGLRASECCNLTMDDLDFDRQTLLVKLGKGNKRRAVGLNLITIDALKAYIQHERSDAGFPNLFLNKIGEPMDRHGLRQRIERLGKLAGLEVSPHALRRAFVTINANKGRSLVMLQMACGHADIKTTRAYCRTTEDEVIAAMKEWE